MDSLLHKILLDFHISGVFLLLIGLAIEMIALYGLRRVKTKADLAKVLYALPAVERIAPIGTGLILAAGIWMAFLGGAEYSWHSAWIITAFIAVIAFSINGGIIVGKKLEHIATTAAQTSDDEFSTELAALCHDSWLHFSSWMDITGVFAIIWLMVGKPGWLGSILTMLIGLLAGWLVAWVIKQLAATRKPTMKTAH